ncbi:MAG: AAA family ATPase [Patescibacteria group bacterium]|jgi:chromosome segregation protein|nr:AAA family ATPase [Patescibacteria group bacterium]
MYLSKIEIQGFKSFAQKTILEFPRPGQGCPLVTANGEPISQARLEKGVCGIACIVGPNGSGKSNIVDAIRWVLGEQSLKSLRGRKSQDVIFSGSEKKSQLGLAQVSLHINNEDGAMPLDYEEVVISRKLYRNGESEYLINKSKVRLQDVIMLVAKANFGQKSYSIVSQGSIDQVIMASPAERKDYFDEAVGVKEFQLKRDQSINKLENAWNNLRQVDALLTEITPRLNSLTRQVKRLERREKVEQELKEISQKYYGWLHHQLIAQIRELKPKLQNQEKNLAEYAAGLQELQNQLRALEKQDSRSKIFNDLQQHYQGILEQKNKLREEQLMLQNKIELAKQRLIEKAVPLALSEIIQRLKEIETLEDSIITNIESQEAAKLAQAKADARELARLIKDLVGQLENPKFKEKVQAEIDPQLLEDLKEVEADLAGINERLIKAQEEIQNFNQQEEKKKGKFFDLQRQITKQQEDYNRVASEVSGLRVELAKLETRQQDLRQEIKEEMAGLAWLEGYQVQNINQEEAKSEINKLKRQLELIGGVDPEIVKEYAETKERHDFLDGQAEDLRQSITKMEKVINDLDDQIQLQFDTSFKHINKEFAHFFQILFGGGKAELVLIKEDQEQAEQQTQVQETVSEDEESASQAPAGILDSLMAAEEKLSPKRFLKRRTGKVISGIDIVAMPPGKKVSSISMLSGGERSLASIALICAVIANNPSPFVILDEVDAALDEANSQRFSKILGELEHKTQFIVITHNRATMHQADILYGVTMGDDGISKLISLKLEEAQKIVRQ